MLTIERVRSTFGRGISRAKSNLALYSYVSTIAPSALSCDDLLRGAVVFAASAFDLLHHQAFRVLLAKKVLSGTANSLHSLPLSIIHMSPNAALPVIDRHVTEALSHRSFLQPDKIAELYSPLLGQFWHEVSCFGSITDTDLKKRVRQLGTWRNRIVHESDINPDLAGIEEWPILVTDATQAVLDYDRIAGQILKVITQHLDQV